MKLTEEIIKYILSNLSQILSEKYLLPEKIQLEESCPIWGAEISSADFLFKILVADVSSEDKEYALVVSTDSILYGAYIILSDEPKPLILISQNDKSLWMESSIANQAAFLLGMEQLKSYFIKWDPIKSYLSTLEMMKKLINYHIDYFGDADG